MLTENHMRKKILITGSAGFVGRHLVEKLKKAGYFTIGVDRQTEDHLEPEQKCDCFIHGELSNLLQFNSMKDIDGIVHLAATVSVQESIKNPEKTKINNVDLTLAVMAAAAEWEVKRFVFASSAAVYGDNPGKANEDAILCPISPYGEHKAACEVACKLEMFKDSIKAIPLRFFNIYGEGQNKDYAGVITAFMEAKKAGRPLTIYGDGDQTRNFVYVGGVADAIIKALESEATEPINIASDKSITINELAEMFDAEIEHQIDRPGDILKSHGNNEKAKMILGWFPAHNDSLKNWIKSKI